MFASIIVIEVGHNEKWLTLQQAANKLREAGYDDPVGAISGALEFRVLRIRAKGAKTYEIANKPFAASAIPFGKTQQDMRTTPVMLCWEGRANNVQILHEIDWSMFRTGKRRANGSLCYEMDCFANNLNWPSSVDGEMTNTAWFVQIDLAGFSNFCKVQESITRTQVKGRPRLPVWDDIWTEWLRYIYVEGLFESQAAAVAHALNWCADNGRTLPADSEVKKRARQMRAALE